MKRVGKHAIVAIDEEPICSKTSTRSKRRLLRLLLNFEAGGRPALTLVFIGQPRLLPMIDRMPGLEERLAIKSTYCGR